MTEREKIIEELKSALEWCDPKDNPNGSVAVKLWAVRGAMELLKKQKSKKPRRDTIGQPVCPNEGCHHRLSLVLKQKYCDVCGQAVKWE